jgi:hypothetical protein
MAGETQGQKPHRGSTILTLGICSFLCGICGIVALIMGSTDLKEMEAGRMDPAGRGNTSLGRTLGIVGLAVNLLFAILRVGAR